MCRASWPREELLRDLSYSVSKSPSQGRPPFQLEGTGAPRGRFGFQGRTPELLWEEGWAPGWVHGLRWLDHVKGLKAKRDRDKQPEQVEGVLLTATRCLS